MNINSLREHYREAGCRTLLVKELACNDNTKNQIYVGGDFTALNLLPFSDIEVDSSSKADSKRDRLKASVRFRWLTGSSDLRSINLILYPKYPEVRVSSLLGRGKSGTPEDQKDLLNSRAFGRLLFFGISDTGHVIGHCAGRSSELAGSYREERDKHGFEEAGVFQRIPLGGGNASSYELLISALREIVNREWITSMRLDSAGRIQPCLAQNCGGYTLEAALGIRPNSIAEPDFEGWEVKQIATSNLDRPTNAPVTLMTPEPDGGFYKSDGVIPFIRRYGYTDRMGRADRLNFGGAHKIGETHHLTRLRLVLEGFDPLQPSGWAADGALALVSETGVLAASWSFSGLLSHWNRKHARAVYLRSVRRRNGGQQYRFSPVVSLGIGTDFSLFLRAFQQHLMYYDPGIKLENASTDSPTTKRRSQFRIKSSDLEGLYREFRPVDVTTE